MECERCGKLLVLVHYSGEPTWVHPGPCLEVGELDELDELEPDGELSDMEDDRYYWERF